MPWQISDNNIGYQKIDLSDTIQNHPIGTRIFGYDPLYGEGTFIYLPGVASTVVGDVVIFNPSGAGVTARAVAGNRGAVGVAMSANVAGQWGWYQIQGLAAVNVLASYANNALGYFTATAGSIDDAVVAGDKIDGFSSKTAIGTPTAGRALIQMSFSHANGNG
jgi:hypothetical protein